MIFKGNDGKPAKPGAGADALAGLASAQPERKGMSAGALDKFRNFSSLTKNVPLPMDNFFNACLHPDGHKFEQLDGLCAAHCALFLCMRLSGLSPALAIKNMRESDAQFSNDYKKNYVHRLVTTIQAAYQRDFIARGRETVSQSTATLLTATYRKTRMRLNARINTLKPDVILFVKPIGIYNKLLSQFKKTNHVTSISAGANIVNVDFSSIAFRKNSSWSLTQSLFQGVDWDPDVAVDELPQAGAAMLSSNAVKILTTRTRFVLLNLRFISEMEVRVGAEKRIRRANVGHMVLVDLSDPEAPGIFDPNQGWIAIRQGFCSMQFEQVIYEIWRQYSGWQPAGGKGGITSLVPADKSDRMCDCNIVAYQVFQQTLAS